MAPTNSPSKTLNTNTPETEPQHKSWWPLWLLGGLILLFLLMIIILRSLCTDVWYINLLKLNNNLCNGQSSLQQNLNLKDGSIRGPEIAEGAIGLDNLSPSLQVSINNINNQLVNPTPGPAGATGSVGATGLQGATGATGAIGPAGPTDPCVTAGTYFCQNGNNFGATAMLGTNDANNLIFETNALPAYQLDINGNLQENKAAVIGGGALAVVNPNSYGNQTIGYAGLANPIVLDNSQFNRLEVNSNTPGFSGPVTMTDSDHNLGWVFGLDISGFPVPTTLTNSDFNMAFMSGVTVSDSTALVGQYVLSDISDSGNIIGSVLGSTITNSNNNLINSNCILSGCTFDSINQSIIGAQGLSSATGSSMSIMYLDRTTVTGANSSAIVTARSNVNTSFFSYVSGLDLDVSDIAETAILADTMTIGNGTIIPSGPRYSFIGGSGFGSGASVNGAEYSSLLVHNSNLTDVSGVFGYFNNGSTINNLTSAMVAADSSTITNSTGLYVVAIGSSVSDSNNIFGRLANTTISNANQIEGMMFSADLNNITNLTAFVDRSNIDGFNTGNGHYVVSDMTNVESIFGEVNLSTLTNTSHFFGESLTSTITDSTGLDGRFATSIIANSDSIDGIVSLGSNVSNSSNIDGMVVGSTVDTSSRLSGLFYTTDIVNSSELSGITDTVTLNNVDRSSLYALSSSITDTNNSIINTQSSTLSGLDHSILIGNNVTLADPGVGSYDYSFIGADSAGAINTLINSKGDDSWVNLSGGNLGVGSSTPGQKLDVSGTIRQSNALNCNITSNASGDLQCASDERLKDIGGLYTGGLTELAAINTIKFNYIGETYTHVGFSAQNVQTVLPEATPVQGNGYLGLDSNAIVALLVNSVKEQNGKIDAVNTQMADYGIKLETIDTELKRISGVVEQNTADIEKIKLENQEYKAKLEDLETRLQKIEKTP